MQIFVKLVELCISCQGLSSETVVVYRSSSVGAMKKDDMRRLILQSYSDESGLSGECIHFHEVA